MELQDLLNNVVVSQYSDILLALFWIIVSAVAAKLFYEFVVRHLPEMLRKTKSRFDEKVVEALEKPVYIGIVLIGLYFGLNSITILKGYQHAIDDIFKVLGIVWGSFVAARIIDVAFRMRVERSAKGSVVERTMLHNINNVVNALIYLLGFLLVMRALDYDVTPYIASLGIAGLAVALALQSTLSNYFAGFYITSDRSVIAGDYIELDNGLQGYVERIGWRSTRIKTLMNNVVVLPNAKLAEMVLTNYYHPDMETAVKVACGVGYDSDLEKVEAVTLDVAGKVLKASERGVLDPAPFVRFKKFGDSNIEFEVTMRVKDFPSKEAMIHEFIKALHERYKKEGIEIAYPARNIYMRKGA